MLNRRDLLLTGAAGAAIAAAPALAAAPAPAKTGEDAKLAAMLDRFFQAQVDESPLQATSLGLDKGARAPLKAQLDDRSSAEKARRLARVKARMAELKTVDRSKLTGLSAVDYDVVAYQFANSISAGERFSFGEVGGRFSPYVISQQNGAYQSIPDFLDSQHRVATKEDADAYLSRLRAFPRALDQDVERMREDAGRGVIAPVFDLDTALGQLRALRDKPAAQTVLAQSLVGKAQKAGLAGDYAASSTAIVEREVFPALDRTIAAVQAMRARADDRAGIWKLPDAEAYYAAALRASTTTELSAAEIHQLGLEQVAEITGRLDAILKKQGLSQGTVAQRLTALNDDPSQLYPDTDAGREALLAQLNGQIKAMYARLPQAFAVLPKAEVQVKRVPVFIQDGAANGYYNGASLDGTRPATYYINLKDVHDWPKFGLATLTHHEAVPGHHLQISTAQESQDIPLIRRRSPFSAYTEGWALYAEQLASEMGAYQGDPLGEAGFLQSFLFRAARLVTDTGIHGPDRWSREQATDYLVNATGFARPRTLREVDRYTVSPGQACSYKVGHTVWARVRAKAQAALGPRFDLKRFHEVLLSGAMPLTILEQVVDQRTRAQLA